MSIKKGNHTVIKNDDIYKFLTLAERNILRELMDKVENGRKSDGKKSNEYYVVNTDEFYAPDVLAVILHGEKGERIQMPGINGQVKKQTVPGTGLY